VADVDTFLGASLPNRSVLFKPDEELAINIETFLSIVRRTASARVNDSLTVS
jgi:hypothetical protein